MADSVIDFAGLDSVAADSAAVEEVKPVVEGSEEVKVEVAEGTKVEGSEETKVEPELNADGTPKEKVEELPGDKTTPDGIRKLLKAMKDASPTNAAAVKELHGAFERWNAVTKIFPKVSDAQNAKDFIDLVGGPEGYEKLNETINAVKESDALLYAGDPKLIDNIVEDLKSEGKLESFGKIIGAGFNKLKETDEKGYYKEFAPHFLEGLKETNMNGAISGLVAALSDPLLSDADAAKSGPAIAAALKEVKRIASGMQEWYKGLEANAKPKEDPLSPERKKLDEERATFKKQQEEFNTNQSKEFQNSVAKVCETSNNKLLGSELKGFLRMPFFKEFKRENLIPLGNTIKANLYATLKADQAYQSQMKAMWGVKSPDRAKIEEYHSARVESIARDIVTNTVQSMYPGYAKGGSAAGRVAAADAKKAAITKVEDTAVAAGKPIYVAAKPKWESIDWAKDPKQYLYVTGKAYLKGSGKLVTWRK